MAFDPDRLRNIYGCTFNVLPKEKYLLYLQAVNHANYMINLNSPIHRQWTPLPKLEDKLKKYLPKQIQLELTKQSSNKPYLYDYLTPSYIQAYPNYKIDAPKHIFYKQPPAQQHYLINHNIKELVPV